MILFIHLFCFMKKLLSNFTVNGGNMIDVSPGFGNGIVEFSEPVTSLTYTPLAGSRSEITLTFAGTNTAPVSAFSEWGLIVLSLLLLTVGTLAIIGLKSRNSQTW